VVPTGVDIMNTRIASVTVLSLFAASCAFAQDKPATDPAGEGLNAGPIHLDLGADWVSAYYFRGNLQEDDGFILQNWIDVTFDIASNDDMSFGANVGIWNSFHDDAGTAGTTDSFTKHWYESDLYAGLGLEYGEWSFALAYIYYTSPSDAFGSIGEVDLTIAYNDSDLWGGDFALNPYATLAIETDDDLGSEDTYLELGVAPGYSWVLSDTTTIELEFPVVVGLGLDDYYVDSNGDDDLFGYLQAGVDASLPLPLPERYGDWTFGAGVHALFLGDAAEELNNGDDFEVIGRVGVSISY
jgi:hypothetical protein